MASIEYSGAARREGDSAGLFSGITFWLSRQVPSRDRYRDDITKHGGKLTIDENEADIRIHDHMRTTNPAGTYSYTFIDQSLRDGVLADKEQHRAGQAKGAVRQPGDTTQPTRRGKVPFNKDEDCMLWDWMTKHLASGGTDGGNKIYQIIAEEHPRHTFQSWRSRWLDQLRHRQRPVPRTETSPEEEQQPVSSSNVPTAPQSTGFQVPPRIQARAQEVTQAPVATQVSARSSIPRPARSPSDDSGLFVRPELEHTSADDEGENQISAQNTVEHETAIQTMHPSVELTEREETPDDTPRAAQTRVIVDDERAGSEASQAKAFSSVEVSPYDEVKLFRSAPEISDLTSAEYDRSWEAWAEQEVNSNHNAETWKWIWETWVRPSWIKGLLRAREYAERNPTTPEPAPEAVIRTPAELAADKPEVPESPSQRAKANSSKRLVPNSQSTGSQPTTQESEPVTQRKRKRVEQTSESLSSTLSRKKRSAEQSHSTLADRQDDGQGSLDQEELVSEDEAILEDIDESPASPSLTDPDTPAARRQRKVDDQLLSEVDQSTQYETALPDATNDSDEDEEDDEFQVQETPSAARTVAVRVETPPPRLHSSYSSTTTPGNTARQHVISPTPRRRHQQQQPSSSNLTTTTPGNTAAPPITQPHPQSEASQDSELERISEYLDDKERQGFERETAVYCFDAASHVPAIADRALRYMKRNNGKPPANLAGFWTSQDDEDLRSEFEDLRAAMQTKHGAEGCAQRELWLQMYRDDLGDDDDDGDVGEDD